MSSSTLLVLTLLVLWLIVLVPMIFRRVDDGAQVRSVRRYGQAMGLLNRRHVSTRTSFAAAGYDRSIEPVSYVTPRITAPRDEVFVPGAGRRPSDSGGGRRPASAGLEGPMNRAEMSDGRRQMMARRRRSLRILGGGSFVSVLLALLIGGTLLALAATGFCLGLGGYVYFLRTQALRDRERREWRDSRVHEYIGRPSMDLIEDDYFDEVPATMVRIDDDSIDLHNLDTIDLTGVYNEEDYRDLRQRRAS